MLHARILFLSVLLSSLLACGKTESTADAVDGYDLNPPVETGKEFLIRGKDFDRWESPRSTMIRKDRAFTNAEIVQACQEDSRLLRVPLENGQSILRVQFLVHEEGRTCYDRDLGKTCVAWNYHGVYSCFYFLSKVVAPAK